RELHADLTVAVVERRLRAIGYGAHDRPHRQNKDPGGGRGRTGTTVLGVVRSMPEANRTVRDPPPNADHEHTTKPCCARGGPRRSRLGNSTPVSLWTPGPIGGIVPPHVTTVIFRSMRSFNSR